MSSQRRRSRHSACTGSSSPVPVSCQRFLTMSLHMQSTCYVARTDGRFEYLDHLADRHDSAPATDCLSTARLFELSRSVLPILVRFCTDSSICARADTERPASEAIVYFASCLADSVGPEFAPPSLEILASFWLDRSGSSFEAFLGPDQRDDSSSPPSRTASSRADLVRDISGGDR